MHNSHTTAPRPRIPIGLIASAALVAFVPIIGVGVWLWLQWTTIAERYPFVADTLRIVVFLAPVALGIYGATMALTIAWRRWGWRESVYADKQAAMMRATKQIAPLAT